MAAFLPPPTMPVCRDLGGTSRDGSRDPEKQRKTGAVLVISTPMMDDSCTRTIRPAWWALVATISVWIATAVTATAQTPSPGGASPSNANSSHAHQNHAAKQSPPTRRFPALPAWAGGGNDNDPRVGSTAHRQAILDALPLERLTPQARTQILEIAEKPTLFRQLPSQAITCDQDMFLFLTRNPDVLVGLWDLMGITNVQCRRIGPYRIEANDGVGTVCKVDLVYGDTSQHIFVVDGSYDGKLVPTPIRGKGVFVLRSAYARGSDGETTVSGTLDCFVQLESLGVDLIARTLSPIIGRSADSNFTQTAMFISQVSQSSSHNPSGMLEIAEQLPQVEPPTRRAFVDAIVTVARRSQSIQRDTPTSQTAELRAATEAAPTDAWQQRR